MKKIIFLFLVFITSFSYGQSNEKYEQFRNINNDIRILHKDFLAIRKQFDIREDRQTNIDLSKIFTLVEQENDELQIIYGLGEFIDKKYKNQADAMSFSYLLSLNDKFELDIEDLNGIVGFTNNNTIKKYSEDLKLQIKKMQYLIRGGK